MKVLCTKLCHLFFSLCYLLSLPKFILLLLILPNSTIFPSLSYSAHRFIIHTPFSLTVLTCSLLHIYWPNVTLVCSVLRTLLDRKVGYKIEYLKLS